MPKVHFKSNYPNFHAYKETLLPTPLRVDADDTLRGRGVTIAYVDSGFSRHPDIQGRVVVHADCSTTHVIETANVVEISPLSWHGQMTSVIGSGNGNLSGGKYRGIASESNLVLVKVSTPEGRIKEADILRGLRWVHDTRHRYNVKIVNVSVGGDDVSYDPHHPLYAIVRRLVRDGITVVISAGNGGHHALVPPASAPEAITVGGYDDHNSLDLSAWSLFHHNWGNTYDGKQKPDVISSSAWLASPLLPDSPTAREIEALAQLLHAKTRDDVRNILHLYTTSFDWRAMEADPNALDHITDELLNKLQNRLYHHKVIDAHHQHVDGTSVSAPIVSGVIAQMLEVNPHLTPYDIRNILYSTSEQIAHLPTEKQGAGRIRPKVAVERAKHTQPTPLTEYHHE